MISIIVGMIAVGISWLMFRLQVKEKLDGRFELKADKKELEEIKMDNKRAHAEIKADMTITENRILKQQDNLKEDYIRGIGMVNDKLDTVNSNVKYITDLILKVIDSKK